MVLRYPLLFFCGGTDPFHAAKTVFVDADEAYKCLTSIPLNQDISVKTIDQLKKVLAFQSSLAYSKNPPKQAKVDIEPVDVLATLDEIRKDVKSKLYKNNYQFDFAVREALRRTREAHLSVPYLNRPSLALSY